MSAKLTLGPVLFNWPPEALRDFYYRIADEAPVDTVCLGEVVCAKRAPFFEPYVDGVCRRLKAGGKEVVASTLALVMGEHDLKLVRRACMAKQGLLVEANDVSAIGLLAEQHHAIGPFINVYSGDTLAYLAAHGAVRVSLPGELPAASLAALARTSPVELEVQVFGRLPLAISARCYHARVHDLHRDGCRFRCGDDADGLAVRTLDGEPILAINGTLTLSYACYVLARELNGLQAMGIHRYRLSPHRVDMVAVAEVFRALLNGALDGDTAAARLRTLVDGMPLCNGFFHAREGVAYQAAT